MWWSSNHQTNWKQIESTVLAFDSKLLLSASMISPKPHHYPLDTITTSLWVWKAIPQINKGIPLTVLSKPALKSLERLLYLMYPSLTGRLWASQVWVNCSVLTDYTRLNFSNILLAYTPGPSIYTSGFVLYSAKHSGLRKTQYHVLF